MKKSLLALTLVTGTMLAQTPRMSLYEEFTGETCPPCAATNPGLNKILLSQVNSTKVIPIKWQVPIPSAPSATWSLYQTNKLDINWRYRSVANSGYGYISQNTAATATSGGINSAPQGVMDGQHAWVFGATSDHPAYINDNVISTAQSYTSAFSVDMKHEWNNSSMSAVIVTVNITASANFNAVGPLVFRCVMVERLIQFAVQPGTNGEKVFEDVAISAYPTLAGGTSMLSNWTIGQTQSIVLTCTVPAYTRKKEEISMVGFIQDDGNRKVAQAARSKCVYDANAVNAIIKPVCTASFSPVVNITNLGLNAITAMTITPYIDGVMGNETNWTGSLATNAATTATLNSLQTPVASGPHTFSYNISAMNGLDFNPVNNMVKVSFLVGQQQLGTDVAEGFTATAFPPADWTNVNVNSGVTFSRTTATGGYFQTFNSVKYDFFNNSAIGDVDELYLPPSNLLGADAVEIVFDWAYAQKNAASNDKLEVMASSDCGNNWSTIWSKSGTSLATAPATGASYLPDPNDFNQWQTAQVNLPGMNQAVVLVKFIVTNDNGNNLYLDNINLVQHSPNGIVINKGNVNFTSVYPNPAQGELTVKINSNVESNSLVNITNLVGQTVRSFNFATNAGESVNTFDLRGLDAGIYLVNIATGGQNTTHKISVK